MNTPESVNAPPEGRIAHVNDLDLYYEEYGPAASSSSDGETPVLLLLHGFFCTGDMWRERGRHFANEYRVIIPDLRGHGRTANPTDEFTHRQAAEDLFALLDELRIEKVLSMGISTGGMTLTHMATMQPSRIEAIVLIGSTIYFPEVSREIMRTHDPDNLSDEALEFGQRFHVHGEEQIRKLHACFRAFNTDYTDMNFTPPYLSTITARTLIIHGDRDVHFPVEIPVEMYRSIPNSYLWIVPNGGHPPLGNAGDEFFRITEAFLGDEWNAEEQ